MPTINATLSLAKRALITHQGTMATAGDNVANVNTPGYARRRADLKTAPTDRTEFGGLGSGVELYGVSGLRDRFVEQQLHRALGDSSGFDAGQGQLESIESVVGEMGESGLSGTLDRFWNAWQDLANDPTSTAARVSVRETGRALVGQFHNLDTNLKVREDSLNQEIAGKADEVNQLTSELAQLNREIARSRPPSANLEDRRTQLLDSLSKLVNIQYEVADNGTVSVFLSGASLVMGQNQQKLEVRKDDGGRVSLGLAGTSQVTVEVSGGEIGALFQVRDGDLAELKQRLNDLAATLTREVNQRHATGYGLDGSTGVNFFRADGVDMGSISLSDEVNRDLSLIAASGSGLPGDNQAALSIAGLNQAQVMNQGRDSINQDFQTTATWLGSRVADNKMQGDGAKSALEQMNAWRNSVSGVSLDEEMADMIRFQNAFNAAAKIVNAVDTMMQTVIGLGG
jgi:flagellar hook-associated protein 1 FlgK